MSTVISKNVQVGTSGTATNNFTLYQPATPDGTVRLGVGNSGATTGDVITANSSGVTVTGSLTATTLSGAVTGGAVTATSLTVNGNNISAVNSLGFRNRIINGDMRIDQRNAGAAVTVNTSPVFPVDRFYCDANANGVFTAQRSTTAPAGFTNSVILTVTTPRTSIAAGDVYAIRQQIEGFNTADLGWGTASAQNVTLSFWVRSSITGTYAVSFFNSAFNRSYVATYTINAANTFEQKTITIAGDTTGTWLTDNGIGIAVLWDLGSGSNYNGTAGSWAAAGRIRTSGTTNWISTNGATFYITGVQLEAGTVASPFQRVEYGEMLRACQRYFQVYGGQSSAPNFQGYGSGDMNSVYPYPVEMRTAPTGTTSGNWAKSNCGDPTAVHVGTTAFSVRTAVTSLGKFEVYPASSAPIGKITLSAEL